MYEVGKVYRDPREDAIIKTFKVLSSDGGYIRVRVLESSSNYAVNDETKLPVIYAIGCFHEQPGYNSPLYKALND